MAFISLSGITCWGNPYSRLLGAWGYLRLTEEGAVRSRASPSAAGYAVVTCLKTVPLEMGSHL
jgi:hypothetical protein